MPDPKTGPVTPDSAAPDSIAPGAPSADSLAPPAPALTISRADDLIRVVDNENQLEQDLPEAVWKELGEVAQARYTIKADKPESL